MSKRTPEPDLIVTFAGPSVAPETIPMHTLARAFAAVQRMAAGDAAEGDDPDARNPLSVFKIKRGSAKFLCAAADPAAAVRNLRDVGTALADPDRGEQLAHALSPLETLSAMARAYQCRVLVSRRGDERDVLATIEPETYERVSRSLVIEGATTLVGRVERAGGATEERCALRVPDRHRLLYCRVAGEGVVRELGQKLYQTVAARGTARWVRSTWHVLSFTIDEVSQPKLGKFADLYKRVRTAGGDGWDRIRDPRAYLEGATGEP